MPGNYNSLREERLGVMLHYDASASDAGAVDWLTKDPRCRVSYNWLVLDDGTLVEVAPEDKRAWHAGVCRPSRPQLPYKDANSAFYGIAWAGTDGEQCPAAALVSIIDLCVRLFNKHHWPLTDTWRIVGHEEEAWPRGRKVDPTGSKPKRWVLDTVLVREVTRRLAA